MSVLHVNNASYCCIINNYATELEQASHQNLSIKSFCRFFLSSQLQRCLAAFGRVSLTQQGFSIKVNKQSYMLNPQPAPSVLPVYHVRGALLSPASYCISQQCHLHHSQGPFLPPSPSPLLYSLSLQIPAWFLQAGRVH